uniref:MYND-type domain-containing protein n=1 Tax=Chaetoceros debilis TaxID=122233 RepID=A0A7S3Q8M9_9STRA
MGKKSKNKSKKSQEQKAECRLFPLSSTIDEEKVAMIMDVYAKFRCSKRLLSITTMFKITEELMKFEEHSYVISIMVDHWTLLEKCTDEEILVSVYLTFTKACRSLNEFRKAARYSDSIFDTLLHSLENHKLKPVQRYSEMMCVVRRHANLRAKLGQFNDAIYHFDLALKVQDSLHRDIETRKEKPGYERNCIDSFYDKACILGDMANILNMKSIAEDGHVRKETRHQTIETYQKAISSFPHNMEKYENIIAKVATYHCNIGIEYGRMRLWQESHKEFQTSIDCLLRNRPFLSSERKLNSLNFSTRIMRCLAESYSLLGWLWLQQYHKSVSLGLSDTRSKQILNKAEGYTVKAIRLVESCPTSKDNCGTTPKFFLFHMHTQQCYFLGDIDERSDSLTCRSDFLTKFLKKYTSETDLCHGCGQKHGTEEVDMVAKTCAGCKSVFYCNRDCQIRHWLGEGNPLYLSHRCLCPLLRFWREASKEKLSSDSVDSVDKRSTEDAFREHFESFRKK